MQGESMKKQSEAGRGIEVGKGLAGQGEVEVEKEAAEDTGKQR